MAEMPVIGLIRRWWELKEQRDALEKQRQELQVERDNVESVIIDQLLENGLGNLSIEMADGTKRTFYVAEIVRARKAGEDIERDAIVDALLADGLEDLCPRGFNWNQLHAYARERRESGEPLPEHLDKVLNIVHSNGLGQQKKTSTR